ncbi:MAG: aminotransferase class I/II-fold pyridoxal phosphate-dependent enzyme [Acidobacteriota bacterium]
MSPILLDRNENRYGPAPECLAALREIEPEVLFNYTRDFQKGYYSALSRRLAEIHGVPEDRLLLGYGCEDLLKQSIHHFVRRGERCLIPSASWWYYRSIADEVGGVTIEYPIVEGALAFDYDIEALLRIQRETPARILLIASPNNPTGNAFPTERLPEVLEAFRDSLVVYDQAYFGFSDEPADDVPALASTYPNLLVLRTFSKLYGLAGARIGYGIAGTGMDAFRQFAARNLGYSRISERLALAALSNPEYYARVRRSMVADRRKIITALRAFPGVQAWDSDANFLLARFPAPMAAAVKAELERRGLVLKFFSEPAFAHCARITLGTPDETVALVGALQEILSAIPALR